MAVVNLANTQGRTQFFERTILINLDYWLVWLDEAHEDVEDLDRERNNIVKAILLAFHLKREGWVLTRRLIIAFSPYMERRAHWDVWHGILRQAIGIAEYMGDEAGVVNLSSLLARLLFQLSRFKEATAAYRQTIRLARQIGDKFSEARACTNLGYFYVGHGRWHRAEILCCHALQIFETLGSEHGLAHTENHLGVLYIWQKRWQDAADHLNRACDIWATMEDQHGLMRGFMNLGLLNSNLRLFDKALDYYTLAQKQASIVGEEKEFYAIEINIAYIYNENGQAHLAEGPARKAQDFFQHHQDQVQLGMAWHNLGAACIYQGKFQEGHSYLKAALEASRRLENARLEIEVLISLIEYELTSGNRQSAVNWLQSADQTLAKYPELEQFSALQGSLAEYNQQVQEVDR